MQQPIPLEQLSVNRPCPANWQEMAGGESQRFCEHCQKHVHRFSAMTRQEAEKLVCASAGNLCAILEFSPSGQVLTLDYEAQRPRSLWRRFGPLALLSAVLTASLAAMGVGRGTTPTAVAGGIGPGMMMGDIDVRLPMTSPSTQASSTTQPTTTQPVPK